ncbi:MAG: hypothetical protein WBJ52_08670, partial [Methanoregulaceae archaeon]
LRTEILRRELRYRLHRICIAALRYNPKYFISRNRGATCERWVLILLLAKSGIKAPAGLAKEPVNQVFFCSRRNAGEKV